MTNIIFRIVFRNCLFLSKNLSFITKFYLMQPFLSIFFFHIFCYNIFFSIFIHVIIIKKQIGLDKNMKVIDMHCDTISELGTQDAVLRKNALHIDIEKLKRGNYYLQNFALFVPLQEADSKPNCEKAKHLAKNPLEEVLFLIDLFYTELKKNTDILAPVYKFTDIMNNEKNGKISAFLTVEEGGVCKGELANLRNLYRLGVRMLTLTWNFPNELGFPNLTFDSATNIPDFTKPNTTDGLTEKGLEFLDEMERLGMIIDVSHLSDAGFYDVLHNTKKPFVASHSNSRAICPNIRNLTDDMIQSMGNRGCVTGLNFCEDFLFEKNSATENSYDWILYHAKHIVDIGGIECLGLGSDFDGIPTNHDIPDASFMPTLYDSFLKAGFSSSQTDKIFYENVLRVYKDNL